MTHKTETINVEITADLRHTLRTPLNQIIGYSEMLAEDAKDAGQTAFVADLGKIHQAAHTLLNLLDTLFAPAPQEAIRTPVPVSTASVEALAPTLSKEVTAGRILVVDDNASNRDLLARRLQRHGHLTSMAEDGVQALEMLRQSPFDLVLLDIMMPHIDGYEVLARMQADPKLRQIPVIMISALTEIDSVVKCIEMGAEDYLPKPFNPTLLRARIDATLEKKRLREQEQAYHDQALHIEATQERHHSLALMVAGVAHEINTPLGIASTAVSIIENRLSLPKTRELFANSEENQSILEDLLESSTLLKSNVLRAHKLVESFKKISVAQASDQQETTELPQLLQDCVDLFKINARQAKLIITLDTTHLHGTGQWFGYPGHMTQVMMNLLQNAERYAYTNGQGGAVDMRVFNEGEQFGISVQDYGQGIPAENLNKIFEPFFTTGRSKGGSGLGMAIVSNIVTSLFKGHITVVSEPGKGCCFSLIFPKSVMAGQIL
ncbi:response regulator [Crenothrix polyspora]|uniref:histidine kinase n=1 Tax=Crenothrix polyspora TaxID=360316 RepID=A0A1R4HGP5_9GAMM|nr:response regulator [Crenothrix polyspora]SJM95387.1 Signal transduction histidine kinase [Crenothrix polyspora]